MAAAYSDDHLLVGIASSAQSNRIRGRSNWVGTNRFGNAET